MQTAVITHIDVFKLNVPRREPFRVALGTMGAVENILVRIHCDDGLCGLGEGAPIPYIVGETQASAFAVARDLARLWIGKDPCAIEVRLRELDSFLVNSPTLKSAFDMALYDLLAKRAGLPLYALLGGEKRTFARTIPSASTTLRS